MRTKDEFAAARLRSRLKPRRSSSRAYLWSVPEIMAARDAQMRGQFAQAAKLAASMRTDDALFTAYENRLDPLKCIGVEIEPAKGARGKPIADEAEALYGQDGVGIVPGAMADIHGELISHGIAIGYNEHVVREDGARVDLIHHHWPLEHVRWDEHAQQLMAMVEPIESGGAYEVPIVHGDGTWVVYAKHSYRPWAQEACILPGALIWARHAHGVRDWTAGSTAHGNAKVVGELPKNMAVVDADGNLTDEASEFVDLLEAIASLDQPFGIAPFESKINYLTNSSNAWQVWHELVINAEKAAARVYLGTDGMLGAQGGAPGVDIATLFGVATTKIQGDIEAITRAFREGVIQPWCAINFGDSALAPARIYAIPDADADAKRESYAKRAAAFHAEIKAARENGFEITQKYVDAVAAQHDVEPPTVKLVASDDGAIEVAPVDARPLAEAA